MPLIFDEALAVTVSQLPRRSSNLEGRASGVFITCCQSESRRTVKRTLKGDERSEKMRLDRFKSSVVKK